MSASEEFCLSRAIQMFALLLLLLFVQLFSHLAIANILLDEVQYHEAILTLWFCKVIDFSTDDTT